MADKRSYDLTAATIDDTLAIPADKSGLTEAVGVTVGALKGYLASSFLTSVTAALVGAGTATSFALSTEGKTLFLDVAGSGANAAYSAIVHVRTGTNLWCDVFDIFSSGLFLQRADGTTPTGATQGYDSTNTLVSGSGKILVASVNNALVVQNGLAQGRAIILRG